LKAVAQENKTKSADNNNYDNFVGVYASEGTPHWGVFEIIHKGEDFILKVPGDKDFRMIFKASNGMLTGKEIKGQDISVSYDRSAEHYVFAGNNPNEKHLMVKVIPNQGKKLEAVYDISAADIVKRVRQSEDWIHQAQSLHISAEDKWIRTSQGIEHYKKDTKERFPDADEKLLELAPVAEGHIEVYFDSKRFRSFSSSGGFMEILNVWDGRQFVSYSKSYTHNQEQYYIASELGDRGEFILSTFTWPRAYKHCFWWEQQQNEPNADDSYGGPEEFVMMGKQDYRGMPCYVLECYPKSFTRVRRWFVGIDDGLLYGNLVYEMGQLSNEYWTGEYRQVEQGWWYPMKQGYYTFERGEDMKYFISAQEDIVIKQIKANEKLSDDLLKIDFKDGVKVADSRFGAVVVYPYKANRTDKEWQEIREESRKLAEDDADEKRFKDALIGKPAPEFPPDAQWLNGEALTWENLRGKVVILDFWSECCGSCRNDLPVMSRLHKNRERSKITVIGIHTPGSDTDNISKIMKEYDINYPICVDTAAPSGSKSWGMMFSSYGANAIPYAYVIDQNGIVAGHGQGVNHVIAKAHKLV
jgi:thiol-disulfide isomerase/thioredoxin